MPYRMQQDSFITHILYLNRKISSPDLHIGCRLTKCIYPIYEKQICFNAYSFYIFYNCSFSPV